MYLLRTRVAEFLRDLKHSETTRVEEPQRLSSHDSHQLRHM